MRIAWRGWGAAALRAELAALCAPFLVEPRHAPAGLCRRIDKHLGELFVFVEDGGAPDQQRRRAAHRQDDPGLAGRDLAGAGARPAGCAASSQPPHKFEQLPRRSGSSAARASAPGADRQAPRPLVI